MKGCFPNVTEAMRLRLEADYSLAETNRALKGIDSLKAPRLDEFPLLFYMSTWELTDMDLHHFAQGILRGGDIPLEATKALLVLSPKDDKPSTIRGFRTISLCNVSVKVCQKWP